MTIDATVANQKPPETPRAFVFATPAEALRAAIAQFPSQAEFHRKLIARSQKKTLTKAAVSQWLRRHKGAPSDFAPDIEAISDVACEELCRHVSWEVLRKQTPPPVYVPRRPGAAAAAGGGD